MTTTTTQPRRRLRRFRLLFLGVAVGAVVVGLVAHSLVVDIRSVAAAAAAVASSKLSTRKTSAIASTATTTTTTPPLPEKKPETNETKFIAFGACCGIGHRMVRIIPTIMYAKSQQMISYGIWNDVPWNEIFNDTEDVKMGMPKHRSRAQSFYGNGSPNEFTKSLKTAPLPVHLQKPSQSSVLSYYNERGGQMDRMFRMPEAYGVVESLRQNLSPRVLKKLNPILNRYLKKKLKFAVHFRLGNNELGDWERKKWRHADDPVQIMKATLHAMITEVETRKAVGRDEDGKGFVAVFIASDSTEPTKWFRRNVPSSWSVFDQDEVLLSVAASSNISTAANTTKPEQGVWFGDFGSKTSKNLTREELYERMAEGFADSFALGEADALFVPTFSSFTFIPIVLSNSRNRPVYFRDGFAFHDDNNTVLSTFVVTTPRDSDRNMKEEAIEGVQPQMVSPLRTRSKKFCLLTLPELTSDLVEAHRNEANHHYETTLNEESAEAWLHRAFKRMTKVQGHTTDPAEADVFLIPGYLHLYRAIHGDHQSKSIVGSVLDLVYNRTKPHLLLVPTWNPTVADKIGVKKLSKILIGAGVNLWSVGFERNNNWQGLQAERIVPIPYVVRPSKRKREFVGMTRTIRTHNFVFYAGSDRPHAKEWAGCHRDRLIGSLENETDTMDVRLVQQRNRISQVEYNNRMVTSEYCLVLCGDTPTSRSLTSSMALGCIPIRVGSRLRGLCEPPCHPGWGWSVTGADNSHLPYSNLIDWGRFPEVNESQFTLDGKGTVMAMFRDFEEDPERKRFIEQTMKRTQLAWIYGWGNPLDSTSADDFGDAVPHIWRSFLSLLEEHDLEERQKASQ